MSRFVILLCAIVLLGTASIAEARVRVRGFHHHIPVRRVARAAHHVHYLGHHRVRHHGYDKAYGRKHGKVIRHHRVHRRAWRRY